jgi:tetratricopeptide (TPR) repeat protein
LRPHDYYLWLELGLTRDQLEDTAGALAAFNESVRLAPYYSQPRWQRGNLLFRAGRYDEAFADLRSAAASNPELFPNFVDLAWGASQRDPRLTEQIVQPQSNSAHLALARFFATHGKPDEAIAHFKLAHNPSEQRRRELVRQLVSTAAFKQAFELWVTGIPGNATNRLTIYDGGFEGSLVLDESGFGWRLAPSEQGFKLSQDPNQPHSGARSLRVDFSGNSSPNTQIASQLLLVEPAVHYKLNFAAWAQNVVTGGPPFVTVTEAAGERRQLVRSGPLSPGAGGWQSLTLEFSTGPASEAVIIALQRETCTSSTCPIFGSLNLDSFSLERVK